jgi:protein involved in polysaccharide export with SLBB domain
LEKEILDFYVPTCFVNATVGIRISCCETAFVYVSGEFRNPGRYSWTNGMRLKDAIDAAGGFNEFANRRVKVIHSDETSERFRLRGDWSRTNNPALKPDDSIHNAREI